MRIKYFIDSLTPVYKRGSKTIYVKYGQEPNATTLTPKSKKQDIINALLNEEITKEDLTETIKLRQKKAERIYKQFEQQKAQREEDVESNSQTQQSHETSPATSEEVEEEAPVYDSSIQAVVQQPNRYTLNRGNRKPKDVYFGNRTWTGPHEYISERNDDGTPKTYATKEDTDKIRRRGTIRVLANPDVYDYHRDDNGNWRATEPFVGKRKFVIKKPTKEDRWKKRHGYPTTSTATTPVQDQTTPA